MKLELDVEASVWQKFQRLREAKRTPIPTESETFAEIVENAYAKLEASKKKKRWLP